MLNHSMSSVQTGQWDPGPRSKHGSAFQEPKPAPSTLQQYTHVTTATPAKRITFYKSGDSQFGGIRMAVHKRSFKCFDALLDDLTQKVPLPFGVRTITTPRGTNSITHLEQLQDGGCYLCSDRRQAKPIKMEQANKHQAKWYHQSRRPHRPETSSRTPPGHLSHRQRRILLVKNSEPGIRRSIVLSRRSTRSMRTFLEEASEVMQFNIRKLYTADGRKIDSVQSLMSCPGVLVCVGREPFSPMFVNILKKSSEEKLPGLERKSPGLGPRTPGNGARSPVTQGLRSPPHGAQSRTSEYSEGPESKKNLNFGLETKKSIIHPRSDSSNRSTRFSLSSEKSNGAGPYSQSRPAIMNDDIEKRVLVNKDGSLSVEMKVRFRLRSDETLQWSTQIKKSPSLTNDCCSLEQAQSHFLQKNQSESCSESESMSFDPEGTDFSIPVKRILEANHCPCCYQLSQQSYDLWENPAHSLKKPLAAPSSGHTQTTVRQSNSSSSCSSCNSRRVVHCRAEISNCDGVSRSECSQLIQEEMCVTERKVEVDQDGGTHVEVHRVSQCHSRSEVVTVDGNPQQHQNISDEGELMMEEERPISSVSSSSRILQSLKEDQDDEDDELPPSTSQCCRSEVPPPSSTSRGRLNNDPSNNNSERGSTAISAASTASCCCKAVTPDQTPSSRSNFSRASCMSNEDKVLNSGEEKAAEDEVEEHTMVVNGLFRHSGGPQKSESSSVCSNCGGCKCGTGSGSRQSQHSQQVTTSPPSTACMEDESGSADSAVSMQSNKSNLTKRGRLSALSNVQKARTASAMSTTSKSELTAAEGEKGEDLATSKVSKSSHRDPRSTSAKSRTSHRSNCSSAADAGEISTRDEADGEDTAERAANVISAKTSASNKSHTSNFPSSPNADYTVGDRNKRTPSQLSDSAVSAKSAGSNVTGKSKTSHKSANPGSPGPEADHNTETGDGEGTEKGIRSVSSLSAKSNLSVKSHKSYKSIKASEQSLSPKPGREREERSRSQMSARSAVTEETQEKENGIVEETIQTSVCTEPENRERPVSARSAGSKISNRSSGEAKDRTTSVSSIKSTRDVVGGVERTTSAMSSKSTKSQGLASPEREENQTTNQQQVVSAVCVCVDDEGSEAPKLSSPNQKEKPQTPSPKRTRSPRSSSPRASAASSSPQCSAAQQLLPGETRGGSALSVHSKASAKSGKSKCQCGATLETTKEKKDMDEEDDQASGKASSLSRSVSLGLPEDQDTAESESCMSFHTGARSKNQIKMENLDTKSIMSDNPVSVGIPTIKTSGQGEDEEPGLTISRAASAASAKSSRSQRSLCQSSNIKTKCVKSPSPVEANNHRTSPLKSTSSPEVQDTSASVTDLSNTGEAAGGRSKTAASHRPESVGPSESRSNVKDTSECLQSDKPHKDKSEQDSMKTRNTQNREKMKCSLHSSRPVSKCETSSDTALSQTLSAADLLKETQYARPHSQQSETKTGSGRSAKSRRVKTPNNQQELSPSCLPNASPTEVVSEWLQRIPDDSSMLGLGEDLEEEEEQKEVEKSPRNDGNSTEGDMVDKEDTGGNDKEEENTGDVKGEEAKEEQSFNPVPQNGFETSCSKAPPRNWQSSASVMKVLLNSSMGRCHSLPEVSPVYGRRLSTSAKGLLDCLAQLQLIQPAVDPGPDHEKNLNQQYEDIIAILQSLWLTEPSKIELNKVKDSGPAQVTPPRSSSGVDMSSGSGGSGKDNLNKGRDETPVKEVEPLYEDDGAENMLEDTETTRDRAEGQLESEEQSTIPSSLDSPKATENSSSPDKSSANDSSKSPTDTERETVDDTSSGTPPTLLQGSLSRRQSQDPDPVWVLNLLKKLEKQFINHYVNAMAEFKVRWDLDDNLILNTMISELREEVSRRIQSSISQEIKKIQGRAGKGGRTPRPPPRGNLSRESTMTEKRRKMLKVMKNQSVKTADSLSDGETTGDFSDQRSEDEYCPCDACVRKKIAARPLKTNPAAAEAPVMMEFDLLKILQLKKSPKSPPPAAPATEKEGAKPSTEEVRSLEVVKEEDEEEEEVSKEDIKAKLILEEAISEKDEEEEEEEEDKGQTGEAGMEDKDGSDEEQEEEAGETEEVIVNGEEEEDEDGEEQSKIKDTDELGDDEDKGKEEEDIDKTGSGEEESDKETVKEMTADVLDDANDRELKQEEEEEEEEGEEETKENDDATMPVEKIKSGPAEDQEELPEEEEGGGREEASLQEQEATETDEGDAVNVENDEEEEQKEEEEEDVVGALKAVVDEMKDKKKQDLLHQFTRTSVESQPGSLEDIP